MSEQIAKLREMWEQRREFPSEWTRYWALDPGTAVCAVVFGVVPPPSEFGPRLIIEDEIYFKRATQTEVVQEIKNKMRNRVYQSFVADWHAMRVTQYNYARSVEEQWSDEMEEAGVESIETGCSFYPGIDDVDARSREVRSWLSPGQFGGPRLLFVLEKTYWCQWEVIRYKRKIGDGRDVKDKPVEKDNHAWNSIEYLVGINPTYVPQPPEAVLPDAGYIEWEKRKKRQRKAQGQGVNLGPPVPA